jgi:hypothetical protein
MSMAPEQLKAIAAEWRTARRIYPVFLGICQRFGMEVHPCKELESPIDRSEPAVLNAVRQWLAHVDDWTQVHQLRQFLQSSPLSNEGTLRALLTRYLGKEVRSDSDRDKVDFLLVQYFSQCAPSSMLNREVSMEEVAQVMHPVVGAVTAAGPGWLEPLEDALRRLRNCLSIRDLLRQGILYEIRKLKRAADEMYFSPAALVAVTRCNYMLRQAFFRLMRADVEFIRNGLRALQAAAVKVINCRQAHLSAQEPIELLLQITQQWKKPFQAEYAAGHTFEQLGEIRVAVQAAMEQHGIPVPETAPPAAAIAAAASSSAAAGQMHTPARHHAHGHTQTSPGIAHVTPAQSSSVATKAQAATAPGKTGSVPRLPAQYVAPASSAMPAFEDDLLGVEGAPARSAPASPALAPVAPAAAAAAAPSPTGITGELQTVMKQLAQYIAVEAAHGPNATATIVVGDARLTLSSWEVKAFTEGLEEFTEATQNAVAVRVLLFQTLEASKRGGPMQKLAQIVGRAHDEAARLQEAVAESRDARNIEATVTLSATAQRLTQQIEDAEALLKRR